MMACSSPRAAIGPMSSWPTMAWNCPATLSLVTAVRSMAILVTTLRRPAPTVAWPAMPPAAPAFALPGDAHVPGTPQPELTIA
jgi:hypothetical protein